MPNIEYIIRRVCKKAARVLTSAQLQDEAVQLRVTQIINRTLARYYVHVEKIELRVSRR